MHQCIATWSRFRDLTVVGRALALLEIKSTPILANWNLHVFKIVYRRYTAFSLESIEQTFNGTADFGKKVTCTISRNGDLIHRTYLQVQLPDVTVPKGSAPTGGSIGFRWLDWPGHTLIKSVELEIGGQRIDKHYSTWLHIWNELTQTSGHASGYANMVGNTPDLTAITSVLSTATSDAHVTGKVLYIPLQFWFCNNPGLALPLIALQYHEVKINIEFAPVSDMYWAGTKASSSADWVTSSSVVTVPPLAYASLYVDYVYLDTEERRRFAQVSHEYLISQVQYTGPETATGINNKVKLNFNHPVKELVWAVQPSKSVSSDTALGPQWYNFTDAVYADPTGQTTGWEYLLAGAAGGLNAIRGNIQTEGGANPVKWGKLQLNGHDRFSGRDGSYFNLVQPYQHHTNVPSKGINVYSFALLPEEHQPSGTCNMSRIDNATLQLTLTSATLSGQSATIFVFAINYNVLRIMSGMGGLAYSN